MNKKQQFLPLVLFLMSVYLSAKLLTLGNTGNPAENPTYILDMSAILLLPIPFLFWWLYVLLKKPILKNIAYASAFLGFFSIAYFFIYE